MTFAYLATPYSKFAAGLDAAHKAACEQAALLILSGIPCYTPIGHSHSIALHGGIDPLDHSIWLPADTPMMNAASYLVVCMLDGWKESYGVGEEIKVFEKAGKPVLYMTPGVVPPLVPSP